MPVQKFPADATAVRLPAYRQLGVYETDEPVVEIRALPANRRPLSWQLGTAGENYERAHDTFKAGVDATGLTEAAADARDYYDNELYLTHPALAAVGSTLAGEAFDAWRDMATDPINVATAGTASAPKAGLSLGSRTGQLRRVGDEVKRILKRADEAGDIVLPKGMPGDKIISAAILDRVPSARAELRAIKGRAKASRQIPPAYDETPGFYAADPSDPQAQVRNLWGDVTQDVARNVARKHSIRPYAVDDEAMAYNSGVDIDDPRALAEYVATADRSDPAWTSWYTDDGGVYAGPPITKYNRSLVPMSDRGSAMDWGPAAGGLPPSPTYGHGEGWRSPAKYDFGRKTVDDLIGSAHGVDFYQRRGIVPSATPAEWEEIQRQLELIPLVKYPKGTKDSFRPGKLR